MEVPYQAWLFARMIQRYLPMGNNDRIFITRKAIEKEGLNIDEMNFAFNYLKGQGVIYDHENKQAIWVDEEEDFVDDDPDDRYHHLSVKRDKLEELLLGATPSNSAKKAFFDDKRALLRVGGFMIPVPPYKNEFDLCKIVFQHSSNHPIDWEEIYLNMTGEEEPTNPEKAKRRVYDAVRFVNKRVKKATAGRVQSIFAWKSNTVKRLY